MKNYFLFLLLIATSCLYTMSVGADEEAAAIVQGDSPKPIKGEIRISEPKISKPEVDKAKKAERTTIKSIPNGTATETKN